MKFKHLLGAYLAVMFLFLSNATTWANTNDTIRNLFIPNAFSPNNDGINDIFKVVNLENESIVYFRIYNKWGTIMYESTDNQAQWNGSYKGKLQPQGEYGYIIAVKFPSGVTEVYKGTLMLITNQTQ